MHTIAITKKGTAWFNTGHPWIYKGDIIGECRGEPMCSPSRSCIVNVVTESNKFLAKAFYNPKSEIALRIITRKEEDIDRPFWQGRIEKAFAYRKECRGTACRAPTTNACRLVFSESDGLPGFLVDYYAGGIVVQINALGMELIKEEIIEILKDLLKPEFIILRNDSSVRRLEGLKEEKELLFGKRPDLVEVYEGGVKYLVDVWNGHKTGAYLDQRENRFVVADKFPLPAEGGERVRVRGARILDAFCYQGLFSLHLTKAADEVIAVDSSKEALEILNKNASLNNIGNITAINANVFDKLREFVKNGEKFDLIILDPPPFAKSKKDIGNAKRGYKDLNLRAIQCLNEGGYLVTFCCSYNFSEEEFFHSVRLAAADAKRDLYLAAKLTQSKDHPVLITFPESRYLKGFVLQAIS